MAITSPDNLPSPDASGAVKPITNFKALADATQTALTKRANLYVGTAAARAAFLSSAAEGMHWQDTDGNKFEYVKKGGIWTLLPGTIVYASFTSGTGSATAPTGMFNSFALTGLPVGQRFVISFSGMAASRTAASGSCIIFGRYTTNGTVPVIGSAALNAYRSTVTSAGQVVAGGTITGIVTIAAGGTLNGAIFTDDAWYRPDPITVTVTAI